MNKALKPEIKLPSLILNPLHNFVEFFCDQTRGKRFNVFVNLAENVRLPVFVLNMINEILYLALKSGPHTANIGSLIMFDIFVKHLSLNGGKEALWFDL